ARGVAFLAGRGAERDALEPFLLGELHVAREAVEVVQLGRDDLLEARVLRVLEPREDGVGERVFGELAHGELLLQRYSASVLSKAPVRLVTFTLGNSPPRAGALLEGDRKVLDLQAAYPRVYHGSSPLLESVLAIVETGPAALDVADQLVRSYSGATMHDRADLRLLE